VVENGVLDLGTVSQFDDLIRSATLGAEQRVRLNGGGFRFVGDWISGLVLLSIVAVGLKASRGPES